MAMNDLLSDTLTRIRNGQMAHLSSVEVFYSRHIGDVLDVMVKEGFILSWEKVGEEKKPMIRVFLKYHEGEPVIRKLTRVSKPGRREYTSINDLPKVNNGLGISILTTSSGVMSDYEARQRNVGGEVLCNIF